MRGQWLAMSLPSYIYDLCDFLAMFMNRPEDVLTDCSCSSSRGVPDRALLQLENDEVDYFNDLPTLKNVFEA